MPPGHVYVAHGDLLRLAADAVLIPCDRGFHVRRHWGPFTPGPGQPVARDQLAWDPAARRTSRLLSVRGQLCRYVDTGATPATADVAWLRDGLRQGLSALVADLRGTPAQNRRARPLVALPLAGTGAGGFAQVRGQALAAVVDEARAAARTGDADLVIVCRTRADYTALQTCRTDDDWAHLTQDEREHADRLAGEVLNGELVLFIGAGVSRSAGLPDFAELVNQLGEPSNLTGGAPGDLPAQAEHATRGLSSDEIQVKVEKALQATHHGVAHALLASLRVPEAVTTNFDTLYELAAAVPFDRGLQVVPWDRSPGRRPWLLKAHGDAQRGSLVLTDAQYRSYRRDHGPVASVIQSLFLLARHVLFVGYSLRDSNIRGLIDQVTALLDAHAAEHQRFGTVLSVDPPRHTDAVDPRLPILSTAGADDPGDTPAAARRLEMLLDRVAWAAARREAAWLLDPAYAALLDPADRDLVETLTRLAVPASPGWEALRDVLAGLGQRSETA